MYLLLVNSHLNMGHRNMAFGVKTKEDFTLLRVTAQKFAKYCFLFWKRTVFHGSCPKAKMAGIDERRVIYCDLKIFITNLK